MKILGYVLIALGFLSGIWGGIRNPISLLDNNFMTFLSGAFIFITAGLFCLEESPLWVKLLAVAISVVSVSIYLYGLHWSLWLFWPSVSVIVIVGIILILLLVRKSN